METYTIYLDQGQAVRDSDLKVVAPCHSSEDPDFLAYIAWINAGNQPTIIQSDPNAPPLVGA